MYWTKDVEYGAARKEGKRKAIEVVPGCSKGGSEEDCDRGECSEKVEIEADNLLW